MDRPTKKVELLVSGITAEVYTYYLRGERKEIEAVMLESAKFEQDEAGTPKLKKVDATYRAKMEDKAVLLAVKSLVDKENKELKVETETLDKLPNEDFDELQKALPGNQPKKK
jgi:hypothetical protein